jgi:hypothetical protein
MLLPPRPLLLLPNPVPLSMSISRMCRDETESTYLYIRRLGEVHVVDSIHEVLRSDALATEEAAVEALDGVFAALDTVKFDVDLAISGTGSNTDVHNLPVAAVALLLDVFFEFLVPIGCLSAKM